MIFPYDQQLLTRGSVAAGPNISPPAVVDVQALDDGEAKRTGALDHTATHVEGSVERIIRFLALITEARNADM